MNRVNGWQGEWWTGRVVGKVSGEQIELLAG